MLVRLLEDGYPCWLDLDAVVGSARACDAWRPRLLDATTIAARIPAVLDWVEAAAHSRNTYLWGGTIGPDLDCSGLVQTAFASQGIWLPRDAYQQERFCTPVAIHPGNHQLLKPGDLLFFGTPRRCTHVAIHQGAGAGIGTVPVKTMAAMESASTASIPMTSIQWPATIGANSGAPEGWNAAMTGAPCLEGEDGKEMNDPPWNRSH